MRAAEPKVYLIGEPKVYVPGMLSYLQEVGGMAWYGRVIVPKLTAGGVPDSADLVEFCGRLCYKSWEPGLNKNVTRVREDSADYILNILTSAHGSVLEQAQFNFVFHDVARYVYDEWVRHRVGVAISAQSGRYVRIDDIGMRVPPFLKSRTQRLMRLQVRITEILYKMMVRAEDLDADGVDFTHKKRVTSALRRSAPHGQAWDFAWAANLRTIRHVIEMRTDEHAEEEIRLVAHLLGTIMADRMPFFFGDYVQQYSVTNEPADVPVWATPHRKV